MESRFFRVTAAALLGLVIVLAGVVSSQDTNGEEEDQGFEHQDARCLCKCPDVSIVTDRELLISDRVVLDTSRSIYINSSVTPQDCDCANVVLGYLDLTPTQADAFCPRCKCSYEVRNLSMMKVVVILVIWVISILFCYMGFLQCLDPILNGPQKSRGGGNSSAGSTQMSYQEHTNEEDDTDEERMSSSNHGASDDLSGDRRRLHEQQLQASASSSTPMRTYGSAVINRVGDQQLRWKKQVQEQRKNIYDKHSMLN